MVSISSSISASTSEVVAVVSEFIALHLLSDLDVRIAHRDHGLDAPAGTGGALFLEQKVEGSAVRPAEACDHGVTPHDQLVRHGIYHRAGLNASALGVDTPSKNVLADLGGSALGRVRHAAFGLFEHGGVHTLHVVAEPREVVALPSSPHWSSIQGSRRTGGCGASCPSPRWGCGR